MKKFSEISSLDELEEARRDLSRRIRRKGIEVKDRVYLLKDDYSAVNLFGMALNEYSDRTGKPVAANLLTFVRGMIKFIKNH
jgi:hypothetical protein